MKQRTTRNCQYIPAYTPTDSPNYIAELPLCIQSVCRRLRLVLGLESDFRPWCLSGILRPNEHGFVLSYRTYTVSESSAESEEKEKEE